MSKKRTSNSSLPTSKKQKTHNSQKTPETSFPVFASTLSRAGIEYDSQNQRYLGNGAQARRNLSNLLKDEPLRKTFLAQSCDFVESEFFILGLSPLGIDSNISTRFSSQETLIKILLGVDVLQTTLSTSLIERIPDFLSDGEKQKTDIPKLILQQFRWLDKVVDSKHLCGKLIECLGVCTPELKRDIISFLPEIIEINDHEEIVSELQGMMSSDPSFTVPILDTLTNLSLKGELLEVVRNSTMDCLASAKLEDLPVVIKFILRSVNSGNVVRIVQQLREKLEVGSLNQKSGVGEGLILDVLKSGMRFSKVFSDTFFDVISKIDAHVNHKVLDVWILFVLHGMLKYTSKVELMFRRKVSHGTFNLPLLKKSLCGHGHALSELFPSILTICSMLLRNSTDPQIALVSREMNIIVFNLYADNYYRQEVLGSLISHVGSGNTAAIDNALLTLLELTKNYHNSVSPVSALLQGILDFLYENNLTDEQIRKIFTIFTELTYHDPLKKAVPSELHIITAKHLGNPEVTSKRIGVIGSIVVLCTLGSMARREQQLNAGGEESLDSEDLNVLDDDFNQCNVLLETLFRACEKEKAVQIFIYDELVTAIHNTDIRMAIAESISEQIQNDFQNTFVISLEDDEHSLDNALFSLDEDPKIAVDFIRSIKGGYDLSCLGESESQTRHSDSGHRGNSNCSKVVLYSPNTGNNDFSKTCEMEFRIQVFSIMWINSIVFFTLCFLFFGEKNDLTTI
eukprot:TRINITY_DN9281_c0_g1_i1.p1 TRINITY_DN9281_c0_g1~~TRINITY_DN9281_c0_g1_i1.p1  ORF type:complete len:740 (-),score=135.10 TRINITY_DN9281_c0_g1_i1:8-2227(-)